MLSHNPTPPMSPSISNTRSNFCTMYIFAWLIALLPSLVFYFLPLLCLLLIKKLITKKINKQSYFLYLFVCLALDSQFVLPPPTKSSDSSSPTLLLTHFHDFTTSLFHYLSIYLYIYLQMSILNIKNYCLRLLGTTQI